MKSKIGSLYLVFILCLIPLVGISNVIIEIKCEADFFAVDNLDQIYIVKGVKITKLNQDGTLNSEFSDNLLGDITSIDVSDPLRILVYYREMNQILFLDNKLTEIISPVQIDDLEIYSSNAACGSSQNRFWIYDDQNYKLLQFSEQLGLIQQSMPLDQIIDDFSDVIGFFEKGNFLYLNLKETGVLVFDSYGSYYKTFPGTNISSFQIKGNRYFYMKNSKVYSYNTEDLTEINYTTIDSSIKQMVVSKNKIYLLTNDSIILKDLVN